MDIPEWVLALFSLYDLLLRALPFFFFFSPRGLNGGGSPIPLGFVSSFRVTHATLDMQLAAPSLHCMALPLLAQ